MALQSSGAIEMSDINTELGLSSTTAANLGSSAFRGLSGVASGATEMSDFHGKSNEPDILWAGLSQINILKESTSSVTSSLKFLADGTLGGDASGSWLSENAAAIGNSYELRRINTTGTNPFGPTVFTTINVTHEYDVRATSAGASAKDTTFTVEIRKIGDAGSVESRVVRLRAFKETLK